MVPSSSTSSSRGWVAAGVAVAVLLSLELLIRAIHPTGTVPWGLDDFGEYRALGPELQAFGAAQVSVVGSSRVREALLLPALEARLERRLGSPLSVASYALSGARAGESELVVAKLLAASPPPRLIAYGMTLRQVAERWRVGNVTNVARLWSLPDWWRERRERGTWLDRHLPQVLRNELEKRVHVYRVRPEIQAALAEGATRDFAATLAGIWQRTAEVSPMRGDLTEWQRLSPRESRNVPVQRVRTYLAKVSPLGEWRMEQQLRHLARLVDRCLAADVPVVLFEVPIAPILAEQLTPGTLERFRAGVAQTAASRGVAWVPLEGLGTSFVKAEFREQSHLNVIGAARFTRAVADRVVLPFLSPATRR